MSVRCGKGGLCVVAWGEGSVMRLFLLLGGVFRKLLLGEEVCLVLCYLIS